MRKKDISKITSIINSDRIEGFDKFNEMLKRDLQKVLSEYFDLIGETEIRVEKEGDKIAIKMLSFALRIKNFGIID